MQINVKNLKDRSAWACGWLQKEQLEELNARRSEACKACEGVGMVRDTL